MAAPPPAAPALTPDQRALLVRLERHVDLVLTTRAKAFEPGHALVIPLPSCHDAAVAAELRHAYLSAGWSRVVIGDGIAEPHVPFIQLEASVDVLLSGRHA